ncbi:MAG: hypothetical protein JO061_09215, partial [Acidobacteriaceae bacterium]|nr:hypothetical protein [Acidobacteriaceae bacterium]
MTPSISASFIPEMPFRSGHNRGSALWTVLQVKLCPLRMALFVWFLIALSPGISIKYIPYFTWCATPLLIPLMIRHIRQFKARLAFGPAALLVFVMTLTAIGMNLPMQCAAQAIKAFAILLLLYPFLASAPDYARLGMHTAGFAVILNAILMLLGKVGLTALAQDSGNGRWGTVLNPVGELAFLGLLAFGYGAYGSLHSSKRSWWYVAVCLSAVYNVMTDGSRTGALCLLVLSVYIAYVSVRRGADRARAMRRLACVVVVSICLLMVTPLMGAATGADSNSLVQDRVAKLFKTDSGGIEGSLQTADLARYEVLLMALNAIREHPFWGSGLNSTHIV